MPNKLSDFFISYSSKDSTFVNKLAADLNNRGIQIWFDKWEMKPGNRLRDKINEGIEGSKFFIVLLSPNSINAPWVRLELDSALIKEIEDKSIIVIPALLGKIESSSIPLDLRGKLYVDFRKGKKYDTEIERLSKIVGPGKLERKRYLKWLKKGAPGHSDPIKLLGEHLTKDLRDITIQKNAVCGLMLFDHPKILLPIAERFLDEKHTAITKHLILQCAKLPDLGGLILLSATLLFGSWYDIPEKARTILNFLKSNGINHNFYGGLRWENRDDAAFEVPKLVDALMNVEFDDIRFGIIWGLRFEWNFGWAIHDPPRKELAIAERYVEGRIPGLVHCFLDNIKPF